MSDLPVKERVESGRGRARSVWIWVTILTLQRLFISETERYKRVCMRIDLFSLPKL